MEETIGQYLRRQRERKAIALETVVSQTRIQAGFLEAIEADRFDQIPHSVSAKGFIRSYAQFLQLDPIETLRRYPVLAPPVSTPVKQPALHKELPLDMGQIGKSDSLHPFFYSFLKTSLQGIALVAGLALFLAWLSYRNRTPTSMVTPSGSGSPIVSGSVPPVPVVLPDPTPEEALTMSLPTVNAPEQEASSTVPVLALVPTLKPVVEKVVSSVVFVTPPRISPKVSIPVVAPPPSSTTPSRPSETGSSVSPPTPQPSLTSPPAITNPLVLVLEASAATWVKVLIDQQTTKDVLLQPGDKVAWQASEKFLLTVGNAGGVRAFLNGQDLGALGNANEVMRDRLLTRSPVEPGRPVKPREKEEPL